MVTNLFRHSLINKEVVNEAPVPIIKTLPFILSIIFSNFSSKWVF